MAYLPFAQYPFDDRRKFGKQRKLFRKIYKTPTGWETKNLPGIS